MDSAVQPPLPAAASVDVGRLIEAQKPGWILVRLVLVCWLVTFFDGFDTNAIAFAAPYLSKAYLFDKSQMSIVFSIGGVGTMCGGFVFGPLGDQVGRRRAVITATLIFSILTLLLALSTEYWELLSVRFLNGVALGGALPLIWALGVEYVPIRYRATVVTLIMLGYGIGVGVAGPIAVMLLPRFGWQAIFVFGGITSLLATLALWALLPESVRFLASSKRCPAMLLATARRMRPDLEIPADVTWSLPAAPAASQHGLAQLFAPGLRLLTPLLWICFATALMTNYFLNSWLPLLGAASGLSRERISTAAMLYSAGGACGGILMSILMDRFGIIVSVVLFLLAVPSIALLGLTGMSSPALFPLVFAAGMSVLGAQFGNNAAAGMSYPTEFRAKAVGWALAVGRFGSILGQVLGGALIHLHIAPRGLFLGASVPMLLGAAAAAGLSRWLGVPARDARRAG